MNQKEFNTILSLVNPKMLFVHELRVEDLSIISSLKDVEVLALEWNTKAQSLWDLSKILFKIFIHNRFFKVE